MAAILRSIGFKIFGVAVCLLLLMVAASIWSLHTTASVNRQLTALSRAMIPLTAVLDDLGDEILREELFLATAAGQGTDAAAIMKLVTERSAKVDKFLDEARGLIAKGATLAQLESARLEFARLPPMLDEIGRQYRRYLADAQRLLEAPVDPSHAGRALLVTVAQEDIDALNRSIESIVSELHAFVASGAHLVEENEGRALVANVALITAAALVGLLLALVVSRGLVQPLRRLLAGTLAVEAGRLDSEVPVTSADEIGDVTRAFNHMVGELRAKERIRETFGQYVDPRIVSELIEGRAAEASGGNKQIVTVFFSDIAGFTSLSERLTPGGVVSLINEYFTVMSQPIRDHNGIIDKYIGDSIMAFWSPPFVERAQQAVQACTAALEQFERLAEFRTRIPDLIGLRQGVPVIDMRVGLASGEAIVGSIGSKFARGFTVMGDTVNLGSRLESTNKVYGTHILMESTTRDMAGDAVEARELDLLTVVGKTEPVRVYELCGLRGQLSAERQELHGRFAEALAAYRAGTWASAAAGFEDCLKRDAGDKPSRVFLDRVAKLVADPPAQWDGVWRLTSK